MFKPHHRLLILVPQLALAAGSQQSLRQSPVVTQGSLPWTFRMSRSSALSRPFLLGVFSLKEEETDKKGLKGTVGRGLGP